MQAKLLRVLQEGTVRRLGSNHERRVDVRVVAATNRDPRQAVLAGRFRSDLYYRLRVLPISIPPLRERQSDVALLAEHFLEHFCRLEGKPLHGFAPGALRRLAAYAWPGNVRELENEIHRLVVHAGGRIGPDLLDPGIRAATPDGDDERPLRDILRDVETATILARLRTCGYHRAETARSLGMTREWLWARMGRLGLGPGLPCAPVRKRRGASSRGCAASTSGPPRRALVAHKTLASSPERA
jgi:DNA-binding NtrC family response regulator